MASLKIHGIARSRAIRNIWAAEECGAPYDHIKVNWTDGGTTDAAFLKLNPNAAVPAIEDGSFSMFESLAIDLYIAKKYGKGGFYPKSLEDEARTWQWTLWVATEVEKHTGPYAMHTWMKPPAERDAKVAAEAWKALAKPFAVLDGQLAKAPYLLGPEFTVADLNVACVFIAAVVNKQDFSQWKNMDAWMKRCLDRPAAKKILALRAAG